MLLSEFITRTGYTPKTAEEYRQIEAEYYAYPGDKDQFCHDWAQRNLPRLTEGQVIHFADEAETEAYVLRCIKDDRVFQTIGRCAVMIW